MLIEPAYVDFVDRIAMGEVVLRPAGRLLHPYLQAHPQRVADLRRLLPRALHGVEAHWSFHDGQLMLEHLQLPEGHDTVEEMLLWRALFPGLPRRLPAWWLEGQWLCCGYDALTGHMRRHHYWLQLHQGTLEEPVARPADGEEEYPYWYRLVALPLFLLVLPFLFAWWWWKQFRRQALRVQALLAGMMVLVYVALPYIVLHPRGMEDPLLARLSGLLEAEKIAATQRKAIARLVAKGGVRQGR